MSKKACKGGKAKWLLIGVLFTILAVGAFGYLVPILDCPLCEPTDGFQPKVGDVSGPTSCVPCKGSGNMTVWDYIQTSDVEIRK